ncbi:MAG: hypothetical protein GX774_20285 [Armatimonadetes bacterium]|nr:hypothetical protein [Armatimonadota bacterium]
MKLLAALTCLLAAVVAGAGSADAARPREKPMRPITLHPDNPHYFLFRGKPTVLISSGEHYGAVLNGEFQYVPYLEELRAHGLNQTRLFAGTYREIAGTFRITGNTLAPKPEHYIAPWPRTSTPGAADGANKFDLKRWNEAYFPRLRDFCVQAGRRGVVVEVVLFCPFYDESLWQINPMNAANNVNGIGKVSLTEAFTLKEPELVAVQEALTRRIVTELRDLDNVYYEICNEAYFGGVTLEWQHRIAEVITAAEADLPYRHLIAQNVANGSARVENLHPAISVLNFHYASPPDAVAVNYDLNRPVVFDETGFAGQSDATYRSQAWEFLLAGGAGFSHLDFSFTVGHEDGSFQYPETQPGGGSRTLRQQLGILKRFVQGFDFLKMVPAHEVVRSRVPAGREVRVLAEQGRAYARYVRDGTETRLVLNLPAGRYRVEWVSPRTGQVEKRETLRHPGGEATLVSPIYAEDIALRIRAAR